MTAWSRGTKTKICRLRLNRLEGKEIRKILLITQKSTTIGRVPGGFGGAIDRCQQRRATGNGARVRWPAYASSPVNSFYKPLPPYLLSLSKVMVDGDNDSPVHCILLSPNGNIKMQANRCYRRRRRRRSSLFYFIYGSMCTGPSII